MQERLNVAKTAHDNLIKYNANTQYIKMADAMSVRIEKDLQQFIK
jgi:outer membrane protein assembly factor BamD